MRAEVRDAIDSARTSAHDTKRPPEFETVRARLLAVVRELPEDMTMPIRLTPTETR